MGTPDYPRSSASAAEASGNVEQAFFVLAQGQPQTYCFKVSAYGRVYGKGWVTGNRYEDNHAFWLASSSAAYMGIGPDGTFGTWLLLACYGEFDLPASGLLAEVRDPADGTMLAGYAHLRLDRNSPLHVAFSEVNSYAGETYRVQANEGTVQEGSRAYGAVKVEVVEECPPIIALKSGGNSDHRRGVADEVAPALLLVLAALKTAVEWHPAPRRAGWDGRQQDRVRAHITSRTRPPSPRSADAGRWRQANRRRSCVTPGSL